MDLEQDGHTSAPPQRTLRTLDVMDVPPVLQRHPALRWLAPLAVIGIAGVVATGMFRAQATSEQLPAASPKALLAAVQQPSSSGFSGTVVSRLSLGLPELPALGGGAGSAGDDEDATSLMSLLSGSHTLKVWYGGPDRQRIALLGATDETDVFRSGREIWQWASADRDAVHTVLPPRRSGTELTGPADPSRSLTPAGLADDVLRDLDPSTRITVSNDHTVANRSAYELVLTPRTSATTIGSVRIAVDGKTKVPLGVRVYPRGSATPAIDVAFTSITFADPADTAFSFTPPAGARVTTHDLSDAPARGDRASARRAVESRLTTSGEGWATVWTYKVGSEVKRLDAGPFGQAAKRVYGPWGAGRLFSSDLASVLVTDDGRILAGAVEANSLFAAAK